MLFRLLCFIVQHKKTKMESYELFHYFLFFNFMDKNNKNEQVIFWPKIKKIPVSL